MTPKGLLLGGCGGTGEAESLGGGHGESDCLDPERPWD